jgi:hypothetical protein
MMNIAEYASHLQAGECLVNGGVKGLPGDAGLQFITEAAHAGAAEGPAYYGLPSHKTQRHEAVDGLYCPLGGMPPHPRPRLHQHRFPLRAAKT